MNNTLGKHFDQFIREQVNSGRYKNSNEVIRHGLKLIERQALLERHDKQPTEARPKSRFYSNYSLDSVLREEEVKALLQREDIQR